MIVVHPQVIAKARVPIIKFEERESRINFDISFDKANGPEAAKWVNSILLKNPEIKPLCLVVKLFLQQRELNEVYTGGIGSYSLLVMLYVHVLLHQGRLSEAKSSKKKVYVKLIVSSHPSFFYKKKKNKKEGKRCAKLLFPPCPNLY